jgi:hypothetical protein
VFAPALSVGKDVARKLPKPELNSDSWILIEVWPDVKDVTLSAYFLDFSHTKNKNLCEATKRVFDREQETRSKEQGKKFSSYRVCMSVSDATSQGYIESK